MRRIHSSEEDVLLFVDLEETFEIEQHDNATHCNTPLEFDARRMLNGSKSC